MRVLRRNVECVGMMRMYERVVVAGCWGRLGRRKKVERERERVYVVLFEKDWLILVVNCKSYIFVLSPLH